MESVRTGLEGLCNVVHTGGKEEALDNWNEITRQSEFFLRG